MGTGLTFHGQDVDIVLDDHTLTLVGAAASSAAHERSDDAGGDDDIVIPRSDITTVELKPPSLLAYGRLVIATRAGDRHTVQFARGHEEERFATLKAILQP